MPEVLKNYPSILKSKLDEIESITQSFTEDQIIQTNLTAIENLCRDKIFNADAKPEIMVYGIYNAGKSSILNELMREDRAEVDDKPQTDRVTKYDWNGYQIADTPGVSAPIPHENITQEHLKNADVVLFVISTQGAHDKAENYTRMKDIADAGKRILIILNDKDGYLGSEDDKIREIKTKVVKNMETVGFSNADDYKIVVVNAARAHAGRLKDKPLLVEKSNILELEKEIKNELNRTSKFDIYRTTIFQIEKCLENIIDSLQKSSGSMLEDKINRIREIFREQRRNIRSDMNSFTQSKINSLINFLPNEIWLNRGEANQIFQRQIEEFSERTQKHLENLLKDMIQDLNYELEEFQISMQQLEKIEIDHKNMPADFSIPKADDFANIATNIIPTNASSNSNMSNKIKDAAAGGAIISAGASALAKVAPAVLPKAVVSMIPGIGQIAAGIFLASALFGGDDNGDKLRAEAEQHNREQMQRIEAEKQARQENQQMISFQLENVRDDVIAKTDEIISSVLESYEKPFNEKIEQGRDEASKRMTAIGELGRVQKNLYDIRIELGEQTNL